MQASSILWRRLDHPGHESAILFLRDISSHLHGTAVFLHEQLPCRLDYHLICDSRWHTRRASVGGWVGDEEIQIELRVTGDQRWYRNEEDSSLVAGCIDLDLNFSPNGLIPSEQRATVLSFDSMFSSSGGVVFQPLLGKTADVWSYPASYVVTAAIQAAAIPFTWLARRERTAPDVIASPHGKKRQMKLEAIGGTK